MLHGWGEELVEGVSTESTPDGEGVEAVAGRVASVEVV